MSPSVKEWPDGYEIFGADADTDIREQEKNIHPKYWLNFVIKFL